MSTFQKTSGDKLAQLIDTALLQSQQLGYVTLTYVLQMARLELEYAELEQREANGPKVH